MWAFGPRQSEPRRPTKCVSCRLWSKHIGVLSGPGAPLPRHRNLSTKPNGFGLQGQAAFDVAQQVVAAVSLSRLHKDTGRPERVVLAVARKTMVENSEVVWRVRLKIDAAHQILRVPWRCRRRHGRLDCAQRVTPEASSSFHVPRRLCRQAKGRETGGLSRCAFKKQEILVGCVEVLPSSLCQSWLSSLSTIVAGAMN